MKRAILTGATSRIGEAIARRLAAQNVTLVLIRRGCHVNLAPAEREVEGLALVQAAVAARQL